MQLKVFTLAFIIGCTTAKRWAGMKNLPDGPYKCITHANGLTSDQQRRSDFAIEKRKIDCWGYLLDHGGVDDAVVSLGIAMELRD
ncbi:hypothetical protein VFPPC_10492 [Pochonia chlamydosporia 170]|uniref:Uncharacterized protein n=1 Tax=Pochonia chlamydosporia 170 TaxID=1380566 RepID=A0A179F2R2_METCM|nr:hypothetical protein VFPPC_10492 [Pochonia chlamydosporia 170]OAQ59433.1 hypothetical protein VFPPC_10492 [Pochonia chlamydosporia 170]